VELELEELESAKLKIAWTATNLHLTSLMMSWLHLALVRVLVGLVERVVEHSQLSSGPVRGVVGLVTLWVWVVFSSQAQVVSTARSLCWLCLPWCWIVAEMWLVWCDQNPKQVGCRMHCAMGLV